MINFFKRKEPVGKLNPREAMFIESIIDRLIQYPLFKQQIEQEIFVGVGRNPGGSNGSYTYFMDNGAWSKLCDPSVENYDIKNIQFLSYAGNKEVVDLYISEGLIIGYKTSTDISNIDVTTIDINGIFEKHFLNKDFKDIENFTRTLTTEEMKKINMLKNTFKIVLNGEIYYPIHDIGNGNYFAIQKDGSIVKITHDPLQVKKASDTIEDFVKQL